MVVRANGAYLISLHGPPTDDSTPDELYHCAGSLVLAKRLAVEGARDFGYTGAVRWEQDPDLPNLHQLTMTWTEDDE